MSAASDITPSVEWRRRIRLCAFQAAIGAGEPDSPRIAPISPEMEMESELRTMIKIVIAVLTSLLYMRACSQC